MKHHIIILALFLGGCMQTSERMAQVAAEDHEACKRHAAPINECMASIRQQRQARATANSTIGACIPSGNMMFCY